MKTICAALFGRNNLIGTDFADLKAERKDHEFCQDSAGVVFQFCVSNHALGKVMTEDVSDALNKLLTE